MEQRSGASPARAPAWARLVLPSLLALAGPVAASSYLPDPTAEAYGRAITTGGDLSVAKDVNIADDVHANGAAALASGVVIDGDLSAAGPIALRGASVTGAVTPFTASRPLPALPSVSEARDLADRVFEGNQTFPLGTVIDDVVFVAGQARFQGSINGSGTVIAGTQIRFDNVTPGQPAELDPGTRMSFISLGSVWVGMNRALRGELLAAGSMQLHKGLEFSGLVAVGGGLAVYKEATIAYSAPVVEDVEPPELFDLLPADGTALPDLVPEIRASYADGGSGIDPDSVVLIVDGIDRTAESTVGTEWVSFTPGTAIDLGEHGISVSVADLAGNAAQANWAFTAVDLEPPSVTIATPQPGSLTGDPLLEVVGTVTDNRSVASVTVNGLEAGLVGTQFTAVPSLEAGYNSLLVVATDTSGNQAFAAGAVVLDTVPPVVQLTAPAAGQLVNAAAVRVVGRASDARGIAALEINGEGADLVEGGFEVVVALVEGTNQLTVTAADFAGNITEVTREVSRFTLPDVTITSPEDLSYVAATTVRVTGTVSEGSLSVTVNGVVATLDGTTFSAQGVPLIEGGNTVTATAAGALGRVATDTIHVVRDLTPPRLAIYRPTADTVVHDAAVAVSGLVNDIVPGTVNESEAVVTVNGVPAQVANRTFFAPEVPLLPGENTLVAAVVDASGNTAETQVTVFLEPPAGNRLLIVSGNHQSAPIGTTLAEPLVVELLDVAGLPLAGRPVVFYLRGNNGSLDTGTRRRVVVVTDAAGRAETSFTLGTRAGLANQVVEAAAVGLGDPVVFAASALSGPPEKIVVDSGGLQVGVAGRYVPRPLIAAVIDRGHNRLDAIPVRFRVIEGEGLFANGAREIVVPTDSDGRAIVSFSLDPEENIAGNVVVASLAAVDDGPVATFVASSRSAGPPEQTSISGVVLDNTNLPIAGATLRVKGTLQTGISDAEGQFRIDGAPVGSIKLIADGSTIDRPGSWPDLEFDLVTIPGRDNTVNMPIFLLPLDLASGIFVEETRGGTLTLANYPGFALDIAPGSVTFPGGGRSGQISVTVVHNDKVPMTPNFGQQPRMIVTIQPAGARFEPPARLTLPNVEGLAVGEVTEMYSFDHDLGHFVSIGPATVSEDGTVIEADPGVGIVKAGWHCGGNPASSGAPHDCRSCTVCNGSTCVPGCSIGLNAFSEPGAPGSPFPEIFFAGAAACSCSDGDSCTVGDTCGGAGACTPGERKKITSVNAQAQGPGGAEIYIGDPVQFTSNVQHERCVNLDYLWKLGDGTEATSASTSHTYDNPGTYPASLKVDCDDCDTRTEQVSVTVKCPEVEITDADPDVPYVCPDCEIQYTATIDPPGRPIYWGVLAGGLGGTATIDNTGLLRIAADAPAGVVAIWASALPDGSACGDTRTATVFVPEPVPLPDSGRTEAEDAWIRSNFRCALINATVAGRCEDDTTAHVGRPNDGTLANAWQHAYCNCLVTARCGVEAAQGLWDAHEEYEGNPCTHATMDLHNNEIGRQVATDDASQCTQLVDDALNAGLLRWLDPPTSTGCPTFNGTP